MRSPALFLSLLSRRAVGRKPVATWLLAAAGCVLGSQQGQDAVANGDTRSLTLYHSHTRESATITFMRNGSYDADGLEKLNWLLRDWRKDEPTKMDPHLFDVVWSVYRESGSSEPIRVVSAYRSPGTNAMLRRRSRAVAKNSQHMAGRAMDFHLPDVSMAKVREIGLRLQYGGVGYYPTAGTPFVHIDTGTVRHWPRVTPEYLAKLFPDGKTVHIPTDGKPLPGYAEAAAEIEARGGRAIALADVQKGKGFWASLFGGGDDDDEPATPVRGRVGQGRIALASAAVPIAGGGGERDDSGVRSFLAQSYAPSQPTPSLPAPLAASGLQARSVAPPEPVNPVTPAKAEPTPPAKPEPPSLKLAEVPLPPVKPLMLTALYQKQAKTAEPAPAMAAESAAAPLAIANVPLPPARPVIVAQANPTPVEAAPVAPQLAHVPLPPSRPVVLAALAPANAPLPSATVSDAPKPVFAAARVPLPPARAPRFSALLATAPKPDYGVTLDRSGINLLLSTLSTEESKPSAMARVATPSVKTALGAPVTAGSFAPSGVMQVASGRFAGPTIRPLGAKLVRPAQD